MRFIYYLLVIFLLPYATALALPECKGSPSNDLTNLNWNNCVGIYNEGNKKFMGEWKNNKLHGEGRFIDNIGNGRYYTEKAGNFVNGELEGKGLRVSKSSRLGYNIRYVGNFMANKENGFGVSTLTSDTRHRVAEGLFKDGTFIKGKMIDNNVLFEGDFEFYDLRKGTVTLENGTKFVGEFKEGYRHGYVVTYWNDGVVDKANYINNKPHGILVREKQDGSKLFAEYNNGQLIENSVTKTPSPEINNILNELKNIQNQMLTLQKKREEYRKKEFERRKNEAQIEFLFDFSDRMFGKGKYKKEGPVQSSKQNIDLLIDNKIDDALRNCRYHPTLCGL